MLTYADVCRYYTRDDKYREYGWRLMDPNMAHRNDIHKLLWYTSSFRPHTLVSSSLWPHTLVASSLRPHTLVVSSSRPHTLVHTPI
jgi:hypothetical protein